MSEKKTILVVDDDSDFADSVVVLLERAGFATAVAYDGVECLKKAAASRPDAIVLDVMMPVKDGYETLTVRQPFPVPWYEIFPLDFVTENIIPWEIRDERVVDLQMQPAASTPAELVVARAEQVRLAAWSLPAAAAPPQVVVPVQPLPSAPPATQPLPPPTESIPAPAQPSLILPPPQGMQGLQPPVQNAPSQGIPSLGVP